MKPMEKEDGIERRTSACFSQSSSHTSGATDEGFALIVRLTKTEDNGRWKKTLMNFIEKK